MYVLEYWNYWFHHVWSHHNTAL